MNQDLADELVTMMAKDQRLLEQLFDSRELPSESYHPQMKALHKHNASRLKEIIGRHGWPGISLVGEEAGNWRFFRIGCVLYPASLNTTAPSLMLMKMGGQHRFQSKILLRLMNAVRVLG